ncbi:MAG: YvcK family protein [Candidatus Omnitrophica bacterium]|nr:YvcK family protein [Candidatus Omnitrophota bacterium]
MLIGKKFKIIRKTLALFCLWGFLGLNNALAFSLLDYPNPDNFLSPQLNISIPLFIDDYQKVTKAPRWLRPDIVGLFGGTGGNIAGNVLSFSDLNQFLTEKLFVSFIISPHDDGGSSVILQRMLSEYLGYTLSPGDTNNIFAGLTSYFKKRVLRTRFEEKISGTLLRDQLEKIISNTEALAKPRPLFIDEQEEKTVSKITIEGIDYPVSFDAKNNRFIFDQDKEAGINQKLIFGKEQFIIKQYAGKTKLCFIPDENDSEALTSDLKTDSNWVEFKQQILELARSFDQEFINPKIKTLPGKVIDISSGSMGNFLIAAKMIQTGAYDPKRKDKIDQDKYHQGIQELCEMLDIDNGFVSCSTFDPATLYAKLASIAIEKDDKALLLDGNNEQALKENGIIIDKMDRSNGVFDIYYAGLENNKRTKFGLKIREYIEGYVYRNKLGREDSYSEVSLPLDVLERYPVTLSHNRLSLNLKITNQKIVGLEYVKKKETVKIDQEQLAEFESDGQIIFALPKEISSASEESIRSLPRFYIDAKSGSLNIVLDTKGIGVGFLINGVELKIKGRLVIEQTNITEGLHHSGIVDFGFLNNVKPRVNKHSLLAIANAPLFMMGPGSQYTSLMSLLLIPEVVVALKQRVASGKESLFIFNPLRDNETVDSQSVRDIIRAVEKVTDVRFGEIFNYAVVSDSEGLQEDFAKAEDAFRGASSPDYIAAKQLYEKYSKMYGLMDEMKNKKLSNAREASSFSKLAKYSRGLISFDENDLDALIDQGVEVYKTKVILSSREVRKKGKAEKEESIRYDNAQIANIIDQILWSRGALFKQDEKLARLRQKLIDENFDRYPEGLYEAINRIRKEGLLGSKSPAAAARYIFERLQKEDFALSDQQSRALLDKKVIITNLKHTLCEKDGITPKIKKELEVFLRNNGKLIVISGFEVQEMKQRLLDSLDKNLWSSIILVANYGTEAWYWDQQQSKLMNLFNFHKEAALKDTQIAKWQQVVDNTLREYALDRPLRVKGQDVDQTIAKVEDRATMIALRLRSRAFLSSLNAISEVNKRLKEQDLPQVKADGILRTPMLERLNNMFAKYDLPISAVLGGTGTINTMVEKAANKGDVIQRVLSAAIDKGLLLRENLEQILIMGKGNYEIAERLHVPWLVFQVPRQSTEHTIEFKKGYGVGGAEIFLEILNSVQGALNSSKIDGKSRKDIQDNAMFIDQAI